MSNPNQELLKDVLNEKPVRFDEHLLDLTLKAVRRRRRTGSAIRVGLIVAIFLFGLVWWRNPPTSQAPKMAILPTDPSPPDYLVQTSRLHIKQWVMTQSTDYEIVESVSHESLVVSTVPSANFYQVLNDAELEQMLAQHDPIILRQPNQRALLLLDGELVVNRIQ